MNDPVADEQIDIDNIPEGISPVTIYVPELEYIHVVLVGNGEIHISPSDEKAQSMIERLKELHPELVAEVLEILIDSGINIAV